MNYTYRHTTHACYLAYMTQAIINNFAPLLFIIFQTEFQISYEMLGRLILFNFATQIVVDCLAVKFVDRIGYRTSVVIAHGFCVVGLIGLGIFPRLFSSPYVGLAAAVMIYAVGGGLLEVLVSPIVDALPGDEKASAMSLLHSFYCWGQVGVVLVTTLIIKLIGDDVWPILAVLWAIVPLYNLFRFLKVPLMPHVPDHERIPIRKLLSSRVFLLALVLMLCAGASELTMSQWASLFAEKGLGVPKMIGDLLGPCLFAVLMGLGRVAYGIWGSRIRLKNALAASGALCIACYALAIFAQLPLFSLLGCAFCGLSVALMWPGTFSLTTELYPKGGTAMFGILAIFGDLGCSVGPWLAGFVSDAVRKSDALVAFGAARQLSPDQLGLKAGLMIAMIFPLTLLIGVLLLKKAQPETE